ncbi:putative centromere binding protein b protein [Eutypa lata UCREL1]|uniref:Putative centromere binding protein b protein n=1 Tax=Eutypa lata (strain UCR-EL1) TaxID=1287681 RepID=M7TS18_EUTLA|nr:putative centromere binding protein b protein [Eutypa lata UCREL1]
MSEVNPGENPVNVNNVNNVPVDVNVGVGDDVGDTPSEIGDDSLSHTPKERHSLTLDQRRALRRWAHSQTTRPSHKSCIDWFYSQYGQNISQSTISHSLSPKYARLDNDNQFSGSRLRFGNWPDVEKLVLLWHGQVVASGRNPSNEELADKAKSIFTQLPRYKDEAPPEFSPGWIHRFKKRYGLLIRRQRRHGSAPNPAEDIPYLVDAVPRFMTISPETSPAAIRDAVLRVVGVEASLSTCARVRDEVIRRLENPSPHPLPPPGFSGPPVNPGEADAYADEDPEVVLQNALRQMQQEEADAEAEAAAVREQRDRQDQGLHPLGGGLGTPTPAGPSNGRPPVPRYTPGGGPADETNHSLTLTPISAGGPMSGLDRPLRCPFCVNQRMLRTIKEAVEHMSTHVVV